MNEKIDYLREKTSALTVSPGVYLMKNRDNVVIYVGKAKNLHNRVSSYFFSSDHLPKVEKMISEVDDYDFIVTNSEYEALILECNFIKQLKPHYNILLMDDKAYTYIFIPRGDYPRMKLCKQKKNDGTYFGPYISASYARLLMNEAVDIFRLPNCKREFGNPRYRPCLRYHMKKCGGYCQYGISPEKYKKIINDAEKFFKSGYRETLEELREEMKTSAQNLNFEKAIYIRDRLNAIDALQSKQSVINSYYSNCDVISYSRSDNEACISILIYRNGNMFDKAAYVFDYRSYVNDSCDSIICQHYLNYRNIPDKIIAPDLLFDHDLISQLFRTEFERDIKFLAPNSGAAGELYALSQKNSAEKLSFHQKRNNDMTAVINRLSQKLGLEKAANYIESYDISNYSDQTIAAGMVVFENGYPLKKAYRHFNIDISSQNDFLSMYITLSRRLSHINKDEKDEYFNRMPDLLLIDGGVEQLRYVKKALDESNLDIPFFGMVKNSRHRTRAVVDVEGREYNISNDREIFDFLTAVQDEVHRYSITYMRKKHKSQAYTSALASVKGIGKVKYSLLMTKYKTLKALKKAGRAELKELLSVSDDTIDELMTVIEEL